MVCNHFAVEFRSILIKKMLLHLADGVLFPIVILSLFLL